VGLEWKGGCVCPCRLSVGVCEAGCGDSMTFRERVNGPSAIQADHIKSIPVLLSSLPPKV